MNVTQLISNKRDGETLSNEQIAQVVSGYAGGDVPDYQMAAFAMAVFFQGMNSEETVVLTREMRDSGKTMVWDGLDRPVVDKHSTGGIGDKISIPLAPMLAACGLAVPMISGRGLGATGGTLDKLESIPGFRTDLSIDELQSIVKEVGCVITGATEEIAPADRKLYALRDVTATVPSVPLITSSILSKKLSEGLDALVLDVKWGSGSFMKSVDQAQELATRLVSVASELGVNTSALITDMNQPLGGVGNAIEINDSVDILKNEDVHLPTLMLTIGLGTELLLQTGSSSDSETAMTQLFETIRSGAAYEVFERMVAAQGGDLSATRPIAKEHVIEAKRETYVKAIDTESIGWAVIEMGGGRKKLGDKLDHSTGLRWLVEIGEKVVPDQPLMSVYCSDEQFEEVQVGLMDAIEFSDHRVEPVEPVLKKINSDSVGERA